MSNQNINNLEEIMRNIRHDLRGPLQAIKNATHVIKTHPEQTPKMLRLINGAVDRATQMLEDPDIVRKQTTNLANLIQDIVHNINTTRPEFAITALFCDEKLEVDPPKMRRVLENLIKNATEAMPNGGNIIITSTDNTIKVSDNGPGISPDILERLFTGQITTKQNGHGIGLLSCKQIVEAHGGTISVQSELGKGTTFTISLPQSKSPSQSDGSFFCFFQKII